VREARCVQQSNVQALPIMLCVVACVQAALHAKLASNVLCHLPKSQSQQSVSCSVSLLWRRDRVASGLSCGSAVVNHTLMWHTALCLFTAVAHAQHHQKGLLTFRWPSRCSMTTCRSSGMLVGAACIGGCTYSAAVWGVLQNTNLYRPHRQAFNRRRIGACTQSTGHEC
jgi:hypothetical protein